MKNDYGRRTANSVLKIAFTILTILSKKHLLL